MDPEPTVLTEEQQRERRDWFRRHLETNVPFHRLCGLSVRSWDEGGVVLALGYDDRLAAHPGVFHGGVMATLIDAAGTGAVLAGHDFDRGSRISTSTLSVQYLAVARGEDVAATGVAIKRGRTVHVATVDVRTASSGRLVATGQVTATIEGERPGLLGELPFAPVHPPPSPAPGTGASGDG